ncbi:hypothetical protein [Natrarchaeobius oligotrophus]|uniref:Uncharacterized protein n=1 Tax=Natrarchaeobius chitinivorans TaxID=1679083 RepID=A0A3N6MDK8_NATCH|nr:hypothetical protein [Natrarchaeobius chitinivorans]RQG98854.1 hypothetical protein EA472_16705 [Natrarchaeobius chitinivorans]
MGFSLDEPRKPPAVFALELIALSFGPPLVLGFGLAAASGPEQFLPGVAVGAVVGVSAASLRNELRGARAKRE